MATSYVYYQEVVSSEHMLYAKELADAYGVTSQKVARAISAFEARLPEPPQRLFFKTRYGLSRVYPRSLYEPALKQLALAKP